MQHHDWLNSSRDPAFSSGHYRMRDRNEDVVPNEGEGTPSSIHATSTELSLSARSPEPHMLEHALLGGGAEWRGVATTVVRVRSVENWICLRFIAVTVPSAN